MTWRIGGAEVTRVADEAFELVLPVDDATSTALGPARSWLVPHFMNEDGTLRIGSSAVAVRAGGLCIVIDPWLAFGAGERTDGLLAALAAAGCERDEVDVVINTHVDGAGLNVTAAGEPTFARARYLYTSQEIELVKAGPLGALVDRGRVDIMQDGQLITDEVTIEVTAGHSSGHAVVHVNSGGDHAVVTGHLFLHPAQVFSPGPRADLDANPTEAAVARRALLERCAAEGSLLVGPLFAAPGAGRVVSDADTFRLDPP